MFDLLFHPRARELRRRRDREHAELLIDRFGEKAAEEALRRSKVQGPSARARRHWRRVASLARRLHSQGGSNRV